ncbi:hypothetical protein IKD67_01050 [Candidatus Saccharibacteria bacterium]|nr:hypothetical protein [Candidatus Saccharibacteria bacterium]
MFNFIKQHKALSLLLFLNVVAVLIVILIIVIHNSKTATVDIMVTPYDAVVELNGARYENMRSHNIVPGDYHVKISMEGMQTKEYDFSIERDGFVRIWNYLLGMDGGFEYYLNHPNDEIILEKVVDDDTGRNFVDKHRRIVNIDEVLPLEYYDNDDPADPVAIFIEQAKDICGDNIGCLSVYGGEKHKDIAFKLIRDAGYSPDDFDIIFVSESENVSQ